MADQRRKRTSTRVTPRKRTKYEQTSSTEQDLQTASESEEYWVAEDILNERKQGRKTEYLVEWKGSDPVTGEPWEPTWEPKANCNELLLSAWEALRASKKRNKEVARSAKTPSPAGKKRQTPKPRRGRTYTVESGSEASTPSSAVPPEFSVAAEAALLIFEAESAPPGPSPKIRINRRGSSLDREAHDFFSQLPNSQAISAPPSNSGSDLDSSELFAAVPTQQSSGIVPDSQDTVGEGTFVSPTQNTTGTTQRSLDTNDSQDEVEEDSGLLEIVGNAASCPPSPAKSIPETVFGPSAESQSQRRASRIEDPIEISDTSDIGSSSPEAPQEESQTSTHTVASIDEPLSIQETASEEQDAIPVQDSVIPPDSNTAIPQLAQVSAPADQEESPQATTVEQESIECSTEVVVPTHEEEQTDCSVDTSAAKVTLQQTQAEAAVDILIEQSIFNEPTEATEEQVEGPIVEDVGAASLVAACQDDGEATATEHPVVDQPASPTPRQTTPVLSLAHEARQNPLDHCDPGIPDQQEVIDTPAETQAEQPLVPSTLEEQTTVDSQPTGALQALQVLLANDLPPDITQEEELPNLLHQFAAQQESELDIVVASSCANLNTEQEITQESASADLSDTPQSTEGSGEFREQNAQIVSFQDHHSTQGESGDSPLSTIEKHNSSGHYTPDSRHDSSQESPEPSLRSKEQTSSPIASPPSHSLQFDSNIPPRPLTPNSSGINMVTEDTSEEVARRIAEEMQKARDANPFTPRRRKARSPVAGSSGVQPAASPVPDTLHKRLLKGGASASSALAIADGTRSPSSIPERSPAPSAPTSLRTVALPHSNRGSAAGNSSKEFVESGQLPAVIPTKIALEAAHIPSIITTEPTRPDEQSSDDEMISDADDDTDGFLGDDLQLAPEEYIVPLRTAGRQRDAYTRLIKNKHEVLDQFLLEPHTFDSLVEVEDILRQLRAIETHIDLVFAEANYAGSSTQVAFSAQWTIDNAIKFAFLDSLIDQLKEHNKHIIIVLEQDSGSLINILEMFWTARFIHWEIPSLRRRSSPGESQGELSITILPAETSPIVRPPDVIVCLDGVQDAAKIRQKNWALNPDLDIVPVLHLVIPRSVSHLERYISPTLDHRTRLHTIFAGLQHMLGDIGSPIYESHIETPEAEQLVADWIAAPPQDRPRWPLGSIGSVKDAIEYETQESQATSPAPERAKRPHDDEELDPAKRIRLTPQPHEPVGSIDRDNEITHISDSMPRTTIDDITALKAQLARLENVYRKERSARREEAAEYREKEVAWEKQQFEHEDLTKKYRLLRGEQQTMKEKHEAAIKNSDTLRERLQERTQQKNAIGNDLKQQRSTDLLSVDEKVLEITKLRTALGEANEEKARAQRNADSAEKTAEYLKEQYRQAQEAASSSQARVEELTAQNAKLEHQASGEMTKLKAIHIGNQHERQAEIVRSLRSENGILKKSLAFKEEELRSAKTNGGRMGVGTRATSATPQPKVRSRAASPMGFGRVNSLRNG